MAGMRGSSVRRWLQNRYILNSEPETFQLTSVDALPNLLDEDQANLADESANSPNEFTKIKVPFCRNVLLTTYRRSLDNCSQKVLFLVGENGVGKSELLTELVTYYKCNNVFHHHVSIRILEHLSEIRRRELSLQWENVEQKWTGVGKPFEELETFAENSAWMSAVNKVVPNTNAGLKTVIFIEDACMHKDTVIAMTKQLIERSNTIVTLALSQQSDITDFGLEDGCVATLKVTNFDDAEVDNLIKELRKRSAFSDLNPKSLKRLFHQQNDHPLALAQSIYLLSTYEGFQGENGLQSLISQVTDKMLRWEKYNARGVFSSQPTVRPSLTTTTLLLDHLKMKGGVEDLAYRLLDILVVMQSTLVPILKLYYIIVCTDGEGFREREPFYDAIALLNSTSLIKIKSERIQVYTCVRLHPTFRKAKDEMTQYLKADPRLSLHFLQYVRRKLPSYEEEGSDDSTQCLLSDMEQGYCQDDQSVSSKMKHPCCQTATKNISRLAKLVIVTFLHSVSFSHIMKIGPLCAPFEIHVNRTPCLKGSYNDGTPSQDFTEIPTTTKLNAACLRAKATDYDGLKQFQFLSSFQEDSIYEIFRLYPDEAIKLFFDVDVLCSCWQHTNWVQPKPIVLPSVTMLKIINARECGLKVWKFNLSLPNLERFVFDNGSLLGDNYDALLAFLKPYSKTLHSVWIDHADVNPRIVELRNTTNNLRFLSVNKNIMSLV